LCPAKRGAALGWWSDDGADAPAAGREDAGEAALGKREERTRRALDAPEQDESADLPERQRGGGQVGVLDEQTPTVEVDACALSRDDCGGKCGHALTRQALEF
jgi:hypothetical protein